MSLFDIMNNQENIRISLTQVLMNKKMRLQEFAKDIGISPTTLVRFLKKRKDARMSVIQKFYTYLDVHSVNEN